MICKIILPLLFIHCIVSQVECIRCYTCGFEDSKSCENFDEKNSSFIINCPPNRSSCGLQNFGSMKIRTCEDLRLNDCQKANNIEYCYCTTDLCNGVTIFFTPSDDEDDVEGSGRTLISSVAFSTTVTVITMSAEGKQQTPFYTLYYCSLLYNLFRSIDV